MPKPLKILLRIVVLLIVVVGLAIGAGFFLPTTYEVERTTTIAAPEHEIYAVISELTTWKEWTPWNAENYPTLKYEYSGAEKGEGAIQSWSDEKMGDGKLEITRAIQNTGIRYKMTMPDCELNGGFNLASTRDDPPETKVVWKCSGETGDGPIDRWFGRLAQWMIGSDFDKGLANLKERLEAGKSE